jgi:alpha-ketoglutarate-dependent taurine dioxygenase
VTIDPAAVGLIPDRTADPAEALALVRSTGAAILTGRGADEAAAQAVATDLLGTELVALPPPAAVREGGEGDRIAVGSTEPLPLHSDGFAYGERAPDLIFLLCVTQGTAGGASFAADGWALLDGLDDDLRAFVRHTPVDLTEPGMHPSIGPLVTERAGHPVVRRTPFMQPAPGSPDPESDAAMIERWRASTRALTATLPRFTLSPGEALCLDNERVLHGRDPYEGERFMWRIWAWTTSGPPPPAGELHSDSRYAALDPESATPGTAHITPDAV